MMLMILVCYKHMICYKQLAGETVCAWYDARLDKGGSFEEEVNNK